MILWNPGEELGKGSTLPPLDSSFWVSIYSEWHCKWVSQPTLSMWWRCAGKPQYVQNPFLCCGLLPALSPFKKPRENFLRVVSCLVIMGNQPSNYFSNKKSRSSLRQSAKGESWALSRWEREGSPFVLQEKLTIYNLTVECAFQGTHHLYQYLSYSQEMFLGD